MLKKSLSFILALTFLLSMMTVGASAATGEADTVASLQSAVRDGFVKKYTFAFESREAVDVSYARTQSRTLQSERLTLEKFVNDQHVKNVNQIISFISNLDFENEGLINVRDVLIKQAQDLLKDSDGYVENYSIYIPKTVASRASFGTYGGRNFNYTTTTATQTYHRSTNNTNGLRNWVQCLVSLSLSIADTPVSVAWTIFSSLFGSDFTVHNSDFVEVYLTEHTTTRVILIEDYNNYLPSAYAAVVQDQMKQVQRRYEYYSHTASGVLNQEKIVDCGLSFYYTRNYLKPSETMREGLSNYMNWQGGYMSTYSLSIPSQIYFS